ncbi:Urea transporter [Planctomycetes bacterium Pan216]|uniref:Urea transporter n=1 Tax=Kolteria novifilia TaxID=2527975 RepID=A0A518B6P9_9BACT|nr:Urea transporter [Planctomycetes bacterium Pan216]
MRAPVDVIFPPVAPGQVPYWRLALRGCSQLCFQCNELTGLFFLAAAAVASPLAAAYLLVAAAIAPGARWLMGDRAEVLETGLPGLNPCLIALSLPAFFVTSWTDVGMWGVLVVSVVFAVVTTRVSLNLVPFPILAAPFLIVFWILDAVEPAFAVLQPVVFASQPAVDIHPGVAILYSLGQALFSPNVISGILFFVGLSLSNWRHGLLALFGAAIGTVVSAYNRSVVDLASINHGLYGFNGVLAAVSTYVVCGSQLRLAILGAMLATMLMPAIPELGVKTLSSPFVFTTWLMLALGWIDDKWFAPRPPDLPDSPAS